jgi:hypothetical protein
MNIGLLDVDGHNFPNLALMKISAHHKSIGNTVEFADIFGKYDIIYKSKVFTWTPDNEYAYNCEVIIEGGTGYNFSELPEEVNNICPDYSLYNCEYAYGFLTRGCIRKCEWCIVPNKEGSIRPEHDIQQFIGNKKSAILMDNNVLAHEHGIKQIEKIVKLGYKIDFNQGLDARLIDASIAKLLAKVKWLYPLRLACDSQSMIEPVRKAVELLRWNNCRPSKYFVYCLIKDIPEALERIKFLKGMYLDPFAQIFRDIKGEFIPTKQHEDLERWVNHKAIFNSVEWENYI